MLEFPLNLIYDKQIDEWIERYTYCEKFNVRPFAADNYDSLPALWVDFSKIVMKELALCDKEAARLNKGK